MDELISTVIGRTVLDVRTFKILIDKYVIKFANKFN